MRYTYFRASCYLGWLLSRRCCVHHARRQRLGAVRPSPSPPEPFAASENTLRNSRLVLSRRVGRWRTKYSTLCAIFLLDGSSWVSMPRQGWVYCFTLSACLLRHHSPRVMGPWISAAPAVNWSLFELVGRQVTDAGIIEPIAFLVSLGIVGAMSKPLDVYTRQHSQPKGVLRAPPNGDLWVCSAGRQEMVFFSVVSQGSCGSERTARLFRCISGDRDLHCHHVRCDVPASPRRAGRSGRRFIRECASVWPASPRLRIATVTVHVCVGTAQKAYTNVVVLPSSRAVSGGKKQSVDVCSPCVRRVSGLSSFLIRCFPASSFWRQLPTDFVH